MPFFITIEGPDGSGKTTVAQRLMPLLQQAGHSFVYTREPGGSEIAEQIRSIVLDRHNTKMDRKTEALLYAASRRQHLIETIMPAVQTGHHVLCDRFIDSSLAYQGYARGLGIEAVLDINLFATEHRLPDLTLYFDVDAETGLARIRANDQREVNRLDLEASAFHQRVREGYLELVRRDPKRIRVLDASLSIDQVVQAAYHEIQAFFKEHGA
jgi:dTMP kinase